MTGIAITLATREDGEAIGRIEKLIGHKSRGRLRASKRAAEAAKAAKAKPSPSPTARANPKAAAKPETAPKRRSASQAEAAAEAGALAGRRGHQSRLERAAAELPLQQRRLGHSADTGKRVRAFLALRGLGKGNQRMTDYVPPKVWTWDQPSGGQFANINRPIAGPTHDQELPVGKHPFQLYSLATPNGQKVAIMFEELLEKRPQGRGI